MMQVHAFIYCYLTGLRDYLAHLEVLSAFRLCHHTVLQTCRLRILLDDIIEFPSIWLGQELNKKMVASQFWASAAS